MVQRTGIVTLVVATLIVMSPFGDAASTLLVAEPFQPRTQTFTPICEIQGTGFASPFVGARLDTYGLVTGVTQDGFYLQDPVGDGDPLSSDGVFVYTYTAPERSYPSVRLGACVAVHDALVQEFYGKTELLRVGHVEDSDECPLNSLMPVPVSPLSLYGEPKLQYERREGMLVVLESLDGVVHGPTKRFQSGEAEIAFLPAKLHPAVEGGRIFRVQDAAAATKPDKWAGNALMYLSSSLGAELPSASWGDRIRSGIEGSEPLRAVLDYNFGKYQLLLLPGQSVYVDARQIDPEIGLTTTAADFTVCTYNVFGLGRGAEQYPDEAEYEEALAAAARVIAEPMQGCTIIGLQETGTPKDAERLAAMLEQRYGLPYRAVAAPGPMSSDPEFPLTNSFLVRTDRVEIASSRSSQSCSDVDYGIVDEAGVCSPGQFALFNRPPLIMDVRVTGEWGDPFSLRLINNHWKSKSGDEEKNAVRRRLQADHVAQIVQETVDAQVRPHVIVLGDLNDFKSSAPLRVLTELAPDGDPVLVNSWDYVTGGDRYSFIFNGASQVLDHVLLSRTMVQSLSGVDALHINADRAKCGTDIHCESCQASDHDPLMVRVRPGGAAAVGGDLGYEGVVVALEYVESGQRFEAMTGRDGAFRLWDLPLGSVRVRYSAPDWLVLDDVGFAGEDGLVADIAGGYTALDTPDTRFVPAMRAAESASSLLDAAIEAGIGSAAGG